MKIGDEVYVHGFVDEIRKDVIIIRNEGGYFGTVPSEMWMVDNTKEKFETSSEKEYNDYFDDLSAFVDILFDKEKSNQFIKECEEILGISL